MSSPWYYAFNILLMDAVANYTLEIRDDLVGTTINATIQDFNEIRVRTCLMMNFIITLCALLSIRTPWWLI